MTEIIPAILPQDFLELQTSLAHIRGTAPFVQVDICDGIFVESQTWPYGDAKAFEDILAGEEGMPFWKDFQFEIDLMVHNPEEVIDDWIDAGASRIIIHFRSADTGRLSETLEKLRSYGIETGLAFEVTADVTEIEKYRDSLDFVQCMGIEHIGKQGNPFDERVLEQIREIKRLYPEKKVSVDGGVNFSTVERLRGAGADRLISGSAIMKSLDPRESYKKMVAQVNL